MDDTSFVKICELSRVKITIAVGICSWLIYLNWTRTKLIVPLATDIFPYLDEIFYFPFAKKRITYISGNGSRLSHFHSATSNDLSKVD